MRADSLSVGQHFGEHQSWLTVLADEWKQQVTKNSDHYIHLYCTVIWCY